MLVDAWERNFHSESEACRCGSRMGKEGYECPGKASMMLEQGPLLPGSSSENQVLKNLEISVLLLSPNIWGDSPSPHIHTPPFLLYPFCCSQARALQCVSAVHRHDGNVEIRGQEMTSGDPMGHFCHMSVHTAAGQPPPQIASCLVYVYTEAALIWE